MAILQIASRLDRSIEIAKEAIPQVFAQFTHMTVEMADRGIPATTFQLQKPRLAAAAERLGFPDQVVCWFLAGST